MLNTRLNRRPLTQWARTATAAALLGLTLPIAGLGAQAFATLSGTITDQTGSVVPGTTLTLSHAQSQAKHEVRSDATGHFQFVGLPAGDYRLEAEAVGFARLDDRFTLASGQTAQRHVALKVGWLQETITVTDQTSPEPLRERPRPMSVSSPKKICEASPIGGRIVPPTKVYDVRPRFPQSLHDAQGTGQVRLEATISADGSVKDVRAAAPVDPDLERAASDAVYQWRFTPTLLNCVPLDVKMTVDISFTRR